MGGIVPITYLHSPAVGVEYQSPPRSRFIEYFHMLKGAGMAGGPQLMSDRFQSLPKKRGGERGKGKKGKGKTYPPREQEGRGRRRGDCHSKHSRREETRASECVHSQARESARARGVRGRGVGVG